MQYYLGCGNATQAAEQAGYSPKTAAIQGHRLLNRAEVVAAVDDGRQKMAAKTPLTKEKALARLNRTVDEGSNDEATRALHRAAAMLGWDEPAKSETTIKIDDDQLADEIANLLNVK